MNQLTQLIAILALIALSTLSTLANWWYAFGIWPISWSAFILFALAHLTITALISFVSKAK